MAKKPIQSSKTDDDNENNKKMMIATTTTPQTKPKANTTTRKTKSSKHIKRRRNKYITRKQANTLVAESEIVIRATLQQLEEVRELALKAGLTVDSNIVPKPPPTTAGAAGAGAGAAAFGTAFTTTTTTAGGAAATATTSTTTTAVEFLTTNVFATTGGHNNTDHVIVRTGNPRKDRIAELKRNLQRRHRAMQPENRGEDRYELFVFSSLFSPHKHKKKKKKLQFKMRIWFLIIFFPLSLFSLSLPMVWSTMDLRKVCWRSSVCGDVVTKRNCHNSIIVRHGFTIRFKANWQSATKSGAI